MIRDVAGLEVGSARTRAKDQLPPDLYGSKKYEQDNNWLWRNFSIHRHYLEATHTIPTQ
jgi:hypothetical protein